ncbi:MAG: DAK2 domain-containing protein [bacterium]
MGIKYCDGKRLKRAFFACNTWLKKHQEIVDALNVFPVPDGDTGTNMVLTLEGVSSQLKKLADNSLPSVAKTIADTALMSARGSSGVILAQFFRGLMEGIEDKRRLSALELAIILRDAASKAYTAMPNPVEGTILTVLKESADKALSLAMHEDSIIKVLDGILEQAKITLEKGPELLPVLKDAVVVDAGGKGFVHMIEGILRLIAGHDLEEEIVSTPIPSVKKDIFVEEYGYCTELVILGQQLPVTKIRETLTKDGKDLLIVASPDSVKVHLHTHQPGKVLEKCMQFGELTQIKIDNMDEQHHKFKEETPLQQKEIGLIVCSIGEGFKEIFRNLGVDGIIQAGQTMNPSVEEILKVIVSVSKEYIILFPNNKNIIPAANQASEIASKNVKVVPTTNIPQAISAIVSYDKSQSLDKNLTIMTKAIDNIKVGEITQAVRDTDWNSHKINKDDFIGLSQDEIKVFGNNMNSTAFNLIKKIVNKDDDSLITLYYNDEVKKEELENLVKKLEESFDDIDIEYHYGGQPYYHYIISVE